jgi:hypothetical protein
MAGSPDAADAVLLGDYGLSSELVGRYPEAYEFLLRFAEVRTAAAAVRMSGKKRLRTPAREWRKLIESDEEFASAVEDAARDFDEMMASSLFLRCAAGAPITRRWDNRTTMALLERVRPELVGGRPTVGEEAVRAVAAAIVAMHAADGTRPPEVEHGADAALVPAGGTPDADGAGAEPGAVQGGPGGAAEREDGEGEAGGG